MQRSDLAIKGKAEHTKRRQQIDLLLKKAMRGNGRAKLKLYRDFGIRLYSSNEVEKYVQQRVTQEYASGEKRASNGPTAVSPKTKPKRISKVTFRQSRSKNSISQGRSKERTRKLVKKV